MGNFSLSRIAQFVNTAIAAAINAAEILNLRRLALFLLQQQISFTRLQPLSLALLFSRLRFHYRQLPYFL